MIEKGKKYFYLRTRSIPKIIRSVFGKLVPFGNISSAELTSCIRACALSPHIYGQATDANTRKADSVYVLFCVFKMFKMMEQTSDCEIRSVIRFLNAINMKPADNHRQICEVYSENAVSD
jgi:hypothetical protein